ncbi:MAG: hypothetical protein JWM10_4819, partial [Myxococcaceae bacterium]|nr:hypothetical protein [Myxococcaceae bacterium]
MGTDLRRAAGVVGGAWVLRVAPCGLCRATSRSVWSGLLRRVGLVLVVAAAGCIFTPRPMIPVEADDGGGGLANMGTDAGRINAGDSAVGTPAADAGGFVYDTSAPSDALPGTMDSDCRPRGDAGYLDDAGNPCDPTTGLGDGGAEVTDASCSDGG